MIWALANYKSRIHDPRLFTYCVECAHLTSRLAAKIGDMTSLTVAKRKRNQAASTSESKAKELHTESFTQTTFQKQLKSAKIVQNLCFLLDQFSTNGPEINYMLSSLLYQIVTMDDNAVAYFFQLPYFATMHAIIRASKARPDAKDFKDLTRFSIFVTRKFFAAAKTNLFLFVEAMVPRFALANSAKLNCLDAESEVHAIMSHYDDPTCIELFERLKGMTWAEMMNGEMRKVEVEWSADEDEDLKKFFECFKQQGTNRVKLITQALMDEAKKFDVKVDGQNEGKATRVRRSQKEVLARLETHGLVNRAVFMTQGRWRVREVSANFERLVLGCINADFRK